ncbi:ABC transporter permease [Streptococcus uberis]|nr:ABC transporter permease [Streptococcus uberis]MCK1197006.1 ABC transporter permease [Streptococcus uberis]
MKVSWSEIRYQPKKFLLIELLIVLMMFMVIFLSGLTNGLGRAVSAQIDHYGSVTYLLSEDAEGIIPFSSIENNDKSLFKEDQLGELVIQRSAIIPKEKKETLDLTYFATNHQSFLQTKKEDGTAFYPGKNEVILDDSFQAKGIALGDQVTDKASQVTLTVRGFAKEAFYGHSALAFISADTYTAMRQKKDPHYSWQAQALVTKQNLSQIKLPNHLKAYQKQAIIQKIPGYMAEHLTLTLITWVLLIASSAILGVFFYILTLQKLKQFGVLKAIGMSMTQISVIQLSQIGFLALFGVISGLSLAILLAQVLPSSMPFYMTLESSLLVSISFVMIATACGALSLLKIRKVDPLDVIGGNGE